MKMKKKVMTLTMGAMLATSLMNGSAFAASITVEKGNTLWSLSQKHQTTVQNLKDLNDLHSNTIYVGQTLQVSAEKVEVAHSNNQANTYVVKKGDTLYQIGRTHGISYQTIKNLNGLTSDTIYPGQALTLSGINVSSVKVAPKQVPASEVKGVSKVQSSDQRSELISFAKQFIGTPYKWGGTTPSGFDCSGFMYYTLKSVGEVSSRLSVDGYWSQVKKVSNPVAGDLVFFQGTYKSGPSHMGIYLGGGKFIHAGSDGIEIAVVNSSYWGKHFLGYGTTF